MTDDVFGDVISSYSRADALADGILVDVSETAREAGITFPVTLTRTVWDSCVAVPTRADGTPAPCQDERGRLWDVLSMLRFAIRLSTVRGGSILTYCVKVRQRQGYRNVTLKAICGPGDDAAPVVTVMLPEED